MSVRDAPADAPLRRDVRLLGDLLGRVLVEQEDATLLADVERVRALAREARGGAPLDELRAAVAALPVDRQASVLRAFAVYFQLANVAEQQHRVRRRREYAHEGSVPAESLAAAFARLDGVPQELLEERVSLELVLTAHPTEAARRTVLASHLRLGALLAELDDPLLAPGRRVEVEAALAAEITGLWQTDEVRTRRPRVVDEIRNGHWFFEQSLIDAAERLLADYRERLPGARPPLRFGSWIGGDADGNPNAGPETVAEALERARRLLTARYRDEVRELAAELGVSSQLAAVSEELLVVDRARRGGAARDRGGARGAEPRRAVPAQALVHVASPRRGRVRRRRGVRRRPRRARPEPARTTAARGSRTARSRRCAAASSSSASTSRSSTCASTPATPTSASGRSSRRGSRRAPGTGRRRSPR